MGTITHENIHGKQVKDGSGDIQQGKNNKSPKAKSTGDDVKRLSKQIYNHLASLPFIRQVPDENGGIINHEEAGNIGVSPYPAFSHGEMPPNSIDASLRPLPEKIAKKVSTIYYFYIYFH